MTPEKMREMCLTEWGNSDPTTSAIWGVGAEIVQRLEDLVMMLENIENALRGPR